MSFIDSITLIRPIPNFPGYYSNRDGEILSTKCSRGVVWRAMRPQLYKKYFQVRIRLNEKIRTHRTHRLIARAWFGESPSGFEIHHINGKNSDNRIENLILIPELMHTKIHNEIKRKKARRSFPCTWCSKEVVLTRSKLNDRIKRSYSKLLFCSRSCRAFHRWSDGKYRKHNAKSR